MSSVHSLNIFGRIPVVLNEYDRIRTGQVETKSTDGRGQQQHINGRISIKPRIIKQIFRLCWGRIRAQVKLELVVQHKNIYSYYRSTMPCRSRIGTLPSSLRKDTVGM